MQSSGGVFGSGGGRGKRSYETGEGEKEVDLYQNKKFPFNNYQIVMEFTSLREFLLIHSVVDLSADFFNLKDRK
ncbi:MAG: hypothetical protein ABSB78_14940 [Bacteroidota bacterium]